jgi:hypothetical protein
LERKSRNAAFMSRINCDAERISSAHSAHEK